LFTKSGGYENWKDAIFNQATIQNIGADKYQNISLPVPSLQDQELICEYLNRKTAQIDGLIAKKERMIELLEEERIAVINQAVTKGLDPKAEMKDSCIDWLGKIPKYWQLKKMALPEF
jgi:type I restriction enzyme S subunit